MKRFIFTITILLCFISVSNGQIDNKSFEEMIGEEDLLVLSDSLDVSFKGEKAYFINVAVERYLHYRILTEQGMQKLRTVSIPSPFDELYKPHRSAIRNPQRLFDAITISYFDAERIREGIHEKLETPRKVQEISSVTEWGIFGIRNRYDYTLNSLRPGDEVIIRYRYFFPYYKNWLQLFSTRLFFHGNDPRQSVHVEWSHHPSLEVDTNFMNGAIPQIAINDEEVRYVWDFNNLPGCLDETGSRPYVDLPWFSFSPKPYELLYEHFNSFREEFVPLWYYLGFKREEKNRKAMDDTELGIKNKDNICFDKLALRYNQIGGNDSSGIASLIYFQRFVADSVRYDANAEHFKNQKSYLKDHPGTELIGGLIKEQNSEVVHAYMIQRLASTFLSAYPVDSRMATMSQAYFAPMLDNEMFFAAILKNNTLAYLMPKSDLRNLYADELPFYYENAPVMLIYPYDYAGYKRNFNDLLRIVNTPYSTMKDNYRKVNCMVNANLENGRLDFASRITLSGQYATLTRDLYKNKPVDSTINPRYLLKVWEAGNNPFQVNSQVTEPMFYFPYKCSVEASWSDTSSLQKKGNQYDLDLSGWIKHVIVPDLNTEFRYTDYYPDFNGSDTWAYMISFNEPVEMVALPDEINFDTDFGSFVFYVKKLSDRQILINSYLAVKAQQVRKEDIQEVGDIFGAVEKADQIHLLLRPLETH